MNFFLRFSLIVAIIFYLSACQTHPTLKASPTANTSLPTFEDSKYPGFKRVGIETENDIFALSNEMIIMAKNISLLRDPRTKANKLLKLFFNPENINLAYKSGANVTASQAFRNKEANCLSLTIMAYAIAKEANLEVAFQSINVPEYWVRNDQVNMLTGHINLAVLPPKSLNTLVFFERKTIEIDFDPFVRKKTFPKQKINKNTVLAMFYNNKGANALVNEDYVTAYAYFRKATTVDPYFSAAWGNLGILYKFSGLDKSAINTYRYAIYLNRGNLTAMANLSKLLHINGVDEEAKLLDRHIMRKRANNPYYYALLGDENFHRGYYAQAINNYKKAIKLNQQIHEFYYGLAKAHFKLDDYDKARLYIKKAIAINRVPQFDQQYLAKLNILKHAH